MELAELATALRQAKEDAYREGWFTGYSAGVRDGGSDSTWCDPDSDWLESKTAALTKADQELGR